MTEEKTEKTEKKKIKQKKKVETFEVPSQFKQAAKPFPKEAYRQVTFGRGFTTIDAYHVVERMTEIFGLCGHGWGFGTLDFQLQGAKNLSCSGSIWYRLKGVEDRCVVHAVGDADVMQANVAEAMKKAQTNMLSKAASFLGVGLSVYQGMGVDDPYLDRAHEQNRPKHDPTAPAKPKPKAATKASPAKSDALAKLKARANGNGKSPDGSGVLDKQPARASGEPDWSEFAFCYHLPYQKKGVDMVAVRTALKEKGMTFRKENGCWYGNYHLEKLKAYIRPSDYNIDPPVVGMTLEQDSLPESFSPVESKKVTDKLVSDTAQKLPNI